MSIYIKGLEKPKSCDSCYFYEDAMFYSFCRIRKALRINGIECNDDCPLVNVHAPHGDLIDRDTLNECCESVKNQPPTVAAICIAASIGQATPIIEAEREETEA